VRTLEAHTDWVTGVAITPNGQRGVSGSADDTLRVWNLESGRSLRMLQGHTVRVSAVAVTVDHTLRVWNLENGEYSAGFTGEGPISRFAVGPDRRTIIAAEKSGRVHSLQLDGVD